MKIKELSCSNYRNFQELKIQPEEGMNVIFGSNAQGKTNLLEAIWLFCGAKSFRGVRDSELVRFGCEQAVNTCKYSFDGVEKTARILIKEKRLAEREGKRLPSARALAGGFYAIVFSPLDLNLVNEGPAVRRKFLDTAIGQIYPLYIDKLHNYNKAVMQRNSLLRDMRQHAGLEPLLDDFEASLSRLTKDIVFYRLRYMERLKKIVGEIYSGLSSGREQLEVSYVSKVRPEMEHSEIQQLYHAARQEDIFSGNTSVGPHRDDIEFLLDNNRLRTFGSQGQRRSAALSVKLAEAKVLKQITGEYPVALLDDVMSELDTERQHFILNHIRDWQVFLTCCDPANISGLEGGTVFEMQNGRLCEKL